MSKGNTSAVNEHTDLGNNYRAMTIAGATEFRGPNTVSKTSTVRTKLVALTFRDKETGAEVVQNYSLDKPSYLFGVLEAAVPKQGQELLDTIDWEVADGDEGYGQVMGIDVICKVYQEEWPIGSGLTRNKIGAVENINFTVQQPAQ